MDGNDDQQHPAIRGLKTVCRCNNIKYRTIARAIRRGACTLSQIAACTTATTGPCGGSCTPDVQEMLGTYADLGLDPEVWPTSGAGNGIAVWIEDVGASWIMGGFGPHAFSASRRACSFCAIASSYDPVSAFSTAKTVRMGTSSG